MPKIIDHDFVREQIAAAGWQVLLREGLKGLSVRAISKELQLSVGKVRHYFPVQEELLIFSMELVIQNVTRRLRNVDPEFTPYEKLRYVSLQFLPLDAERTLEMEVWLQFVIGSRIAQMSDMRAETQLRVQAYLADLIGQVWQAEDVVMSSGKAEDSAKVLHAVLDGLTLRHLAMPSEQAKTELVAIIDRLLGRIMRGDLL